MAPPRPINGIPRRGVQRCTSAGGGRTTSGNNWRLQLGEVGGCLDGKGPAGEKGLGMGWGGAVRRGTPGPRVVGRRAVRWPVQAVGSPTSRGSRRPPSTPAGLSSAGPCLLPSTPGRAASFRPARAFSARHRTLASLSSAHFCLSSSGVPSLSLGLFKLP